MILRKFFSALIVFLAVCIAVSANDVRQVVILQTTDIHGSVSGMGPMPGIARLGTIIEQVRKNAGPGVLYVDCGDLTQGTFFSSLDQGKSMIDALNHLQCDVFVLGNHDFDYGPDVLVRNLNSMKSAVLAANLKLDSQGTKQIETWKLFERNGIRIAVIGITPPYLDLWISNAQLRGIHTEPVETALDRIMPSVLNAKPDLIVLAIHLGEFTSGRLNRDGKPRSMNQLAKRYPQIDLILGGHTHQTVPGKLCPPNTWFVQAPAISGGVAKTVITYDRTARKKLTVRTEIVSGAEQIPSPSVSAVQKESFDKAVFLAKNPSAVTSVPLFPMKGPDTKCRLAEILADAMIEAVHADGAFSTTLSKYKVEPGPLTEHDVFLLAPYENFISTVELTPDEVRAILKEQAESRFRNVYMVMRGVRQDKAGNLFLADGTAWTSGRKIFAFGSYAISGAGGRYPVLKEIALSPEVRRIDLNSTVRTALRDWLRKHNPPRQRGDK